MTQDCREANSSGRISWSRASGSGTVGGGSGPAAGVGTDSPPADPARGSRPDAPDRCPRSGPTVRCPTRPYSDRPSRPDGAGRSRQRGGAVGISLHRRFPAPDSMRLPLSGPRRTASSRSLIGWPTATPDHGFGDRWLLKRAQARHRSCATTYASIINIFPKETLDGMRRRRFKISRGLLHSRTVKVC